MTLTPRDAHELRGIAVALGSTDPRLARNLSKHSCGAHALAQIGFGIAVLVVSGAWLVPLVLGLELQVTWLLVVGVVSACVLLVCGPVLFTAVLRKRRRLPKPDSVS